MSEDNPWRHDRQTNRHRPTARHRVAVVTLALATVLAALASSGTPADAAIDTAPDHRIATVGELLIIRPDVSTTTPRWTSSPVGAWTSRSGIVLWRPQPVDLGRHRLVATLDGGTRTMEITIDVQQPRHRGMVLAMGDSIASGQGLEALDYFGTDACHRDEERNGSWARRVYDELAVDGRASSFEMVACGGARTFDLWSRPVDGGPADVSRGELTQLQWATATNPDLILMTIGANDLAFDNPQAFFSAGVFDVALADSRVASMEAGLDRVLRTLVEQTSARIVVTTVHNPTSLTPHGVDGCTGSCFYDVTAYVVDSLRTAIQRSAAAHPGRVVSVDVSDALAGHGAPNGRGPDVFRAGSGWLSSRLPVPTTGVHPYCQKGHADHDTWINAADCVHPNGEGHAAYAERVGAALTYWRPAA